MWIGDRARKLDGGHHGALDALEDQLGNRAAVLQELPALAHRPVHLRRFNPLPRIRRKHPLETGKPDVGGRENGLGRHRPHAVVRAAREAGDVFGDVPLREIGDIPGRVMAALVEAAGHGSVPPAPLPRRLDRLETERVGEPNGIRVGVQVAVQARRHARLALQRILRQEAPALLVVVASAKVL